MNAPTTLAEVQALRTLTLPDEAALSKSAGSALAMARTFTITTSEDYGLCAEELKAANAKFKALEEKRLTITRPMDAAKKAVMDLFRGPLDTLEQAIGLYKRSMLDWDREQERIAAEQRRAAEEAAAAERRRLEAEAAERQRIADEQAAALQRQAEEAARAGDAAAAQKAAEQAAVVQQEAAAEVAAIESVAAVIVAPAPAVERTKVAGISTAKGWDFEVTDVTALIKDVAAKIDTQPGLAGVLMADSVKLRALVKALGPNLNLAGVRVIEKRTVRAA